ncbi:RdgB/HAM1 family non-canonical purine NTP pyrophosphatase [Saccharibacter sp. 17.LH.SD]|uniref:RdgB/HAM1 family non-canonical purine NTP pyrophosphatase n=1 Tax=Saccharibacter sp. 17.LH.SD TaxID=2689393 RepID=UPI001367BE07|nr:RdgB/HAM1 family non-canonical purine NTP pyrophosphatase [Saccharibacter sp. 17.LH.SD]MXV45021.1 RdgB/HAM1 family non-canonical purine NTP pyrophosphatase [Saccharibacter sp. 17.LH.SD]
MGNAETTRRLSKGEEIVLASHNAGKLREFSSLLAPSGVVVRSAAALNLPEPEEDADSFEGNALIKARAAAEATGFPALADDSGFCVAALGDRPGVYSARWAGPDRDMKKAMARVERELAETGSQDRSASFKVVLCLAWPDGAYRFVSGACQGRVHFPARGTHGHGYDPIFIPEGESRTFAEMTEAEKNRFSHRGQAAERFLKECVEP